MKINMLKLWEQNQDLNFGEMRQIVNAAIKAANDKIFEIRKQKFIHAGSPENKIV